MGYIFNYRKNAIFNVDVETLDLGKLNLIYKVTQAFGVFIISVLKLAFNLALFLTKVNVNYLGIGHNFLFLA